MLSDLAIYYEDDGHPVAPFLIAPVLEQQDTLIVGPRNVASQHDRFLSESFRRMPLSLRGSLYLRVFTYQARIAIILVLPTGVEEESSQRTGLVLTMGALVEKRVFKEYYLPISHYFRRFIHSVNSHFDVDLFGNGADEIVSQINNERFHAVLRSRFLLILNDLLMFSARLRPRKLWQKLLPKKAWIRGISKLPQRMFTEQHPKGLPKVILCNHLDPASTTQLFFWEIDRYLHSFHIRNIDVANQGSSGGKSIDFISLELPQLEGVSDLALAKFNRRKFLKLY